MEVMQCNTSRRSKMCDEDATNMAMHYNLLSDLHTDGFIIRGAR